MTRYLALSQEGRELMPGESGQFGRLTKRQDALGIERDTKLSPQTRFHLRLWKPQAAGDGFRNVKVQGHEDCQSLINRFYTEATKPRASRRILKTHPNLAPKRRRDIH
jgi:hypothetical protein